MDVESPEYGPHSKIRSHTERADTAAGLKRELEDLTRRFERLTIEGPGFSGSGEGIAWDPTEANLGGGNSTGDEITGVTLVINGTGYEDCTLIGTLGTEI